MSIDFDFPAKKDAIQKLQLQAKRLTTKTMADMVLEYLTSYCDRDPKLIAQINDPKKSFHDCMAYIRDQALKYLKHDLKLSMEQYHSNGAQVGGEVPAEIVYTWAVKYYYSKPKEKKGLQQTNNQNIAKKEEKAEPPKKEQDAQLSLLGDEISA